MSKLVKVRKPKVKPKSKPEVKTFIDFDDDVFGIAIESEDLNCQVKVKGGISWFFSLWD